MAGEGEAGEVGDLKEGLWQGREKQVRWGIEGRVGQGREEQVRWGIEGRVVAGEGGAGEMGDRRKGCGRGGRSR